jgi:hypothetical protein
MTATATVRTFRRVEAALRRAHHEASLAYQFNSNSYSHGALDACIAAQVSATRGDPIRRLVR